MLNLSDLPELFIEDLEHTIEEYNLNVVDECFCNDGDLAELFNDSNIVLKESINVEKEFDFNEDYEPISCSYDDYLETLVLVQNGKEYLCKVFVKHNGCGAEDALAIMDICPRS